MYLLACLVRYSVRSIRFHFPEQTYSWRDKVHKSLQNLKGIEGVETEWMNNINGSFFTKVESFMRGMMQEKIY